MCSTKYITTFHKNDLKKKNNPIKHENTICEDIIIDNVFCNNTRTSSSLLSSSSSIEEAITKSRKPIKTVFIIFLFTFDTWPIPGDWLDGREAG